MTSCGFIIWPEITASAGSCRELNRIMLNVGQKEIKTGHLTSHRKRAVVTLSFFPSVFRLFAANGKIQNR